MKQLIILSMRKIRRLQVCEQVSEGAWSLAAGMDRTVAVGKSHRMWPGWALKNTGRSELHSTSVNFRLPGKIENSQQMWA